MKENENYDLIDNYYSHSKKNAYFAFVISQNFGSGNSQSQPKNLNPIRDSQKFEIECMISDVEVTQPWIRN